MIYYRHMLWASEKAEGAQEVALKLGSLPLHTRSAAPSYLGRVIYRRGLREVSLALLTAAFNCPRGSLGGVCV